MKIRVVHTNGGMTTLDNVEKLYLLDGVSTIDRLHENHIDPSLAKVFFAKAESEDKCKKCEYYLNPDYTRCHECKTKSEG